MSKEVEQCSHSVDIVENPKFYKRKKKTEEENHAELKCEVHIKLEVLWKTTNLD